MDKMTFASYKFKPSDVINGLNRYFAETKANRYLRVPLEIRNGVCFNNPDCVKDIIFNSLHDWDTKSGRVRGAYYLICDPEEVVGVAINWLREEHDIFYTPGMEVPKKDCDIFCEENLDMVPVANVREALGIGEDSDIFECIKHRNHQLETLRTELAASRRMYHNAIKERSQFGRRLMDIRKAAGMADGDQTDLAKYIDTLRETAEENSVLRGNLDYFEDLAQGRQKALSNLHDEIDKVYREIFSNGDPEGTYKETLQDILTEYQRCLKLKDVAEEKAINYKELARENEDKAAKYKDIAKENRVQWNNTRDQLQWAQKENLEWVARYEKLKSELNRYKWLYTNLKNGVESVLQEAEDKED